jgi:hypothetical protein
MVGGLLRCPLLAFWWFTLAFFGIGLEFCPGYFHYFAVAEDALSESERDLCRGMNWLHQLFHILCRRRKSKAKPSGIHFVSRRLWERVKDFRITGAARRHGTEDRGVREYLCARETRKTAY